MDNKTPHPSSTNALHGQIRGFWKTLRSRTEPRPSNENLVTCVTKLLVSLAQSDHNFDPVERDVIIEILRSGFDQSSLQAQKLVKESERARSIDLLQYVTDLNQRLDYSDKLDLARALWAVCLADGHTARMELAITSSVFSILKIRNADIEELKSAAATFLTETLQQSALDKPI